MKRLSCLLLAVPFTLTLPLTLFAACVDGSADPNPPDAPPGLGVAESEILTDSGILPDVPATAIPAGYGKYCSVTDPTNGGWALRAVASGDPCGDLRASVGPNAVVARAGLWDTQGNNNVMVRCDGGVLHFGRAAGASAINWIFGLVTTAQKNCVFIVSPAKLAVYSSPFTVAATTTITSPSVFGYHLNQEGNAAPWDTAEFGRIGSNACEVDRTGTRTQLCPAISLGGNPYPVPEAAYDWSVAQDTPLLAVADGVIRASYGRAVASSCGPDAQQELFLETQVGTGQYAEHFVAAYHHMNPSPSFADPAIVANWLKWGNRPMAPAGTLVKKGEVIAYVGSSGCSGGPHLDLMGFRLTNLTGARSYTFAIKPTGAGVNGWQGVFDQFGWAAPGGVDPLAYKFIGMADAFSPPAGINGMGTFSINLWDSFAFAHLPHNGGASW